MEEIYEKMGECLGKEMHGVMDGVQRRGDRWDRVKDQMGIFRVMRDNLKQMYRIGKGSQGKAKNS